MARLQQFYKEKVVADLTEKFGYKSAMQVPRLTKITLNMGVGEAIADKKVLEHAVSDLTKIAGQKPVTTKARKAIAGFKIREGYPIGTMSSSQYGGSLQNRYSPAMQAGPWWWYGGGGVGAGTARFRTRGAAVAAGCGRADGRRRRSRACR